jgi:signal peptidase I
VTVIERIRRFLKRRNHGQITRQILKQTRYYLNCRIDLLDTLQIESLHRIEERCRALIKDPAAKPDLDTTAEELSRLIAKTSPKRQYPKLTENLEIAVVALSIALGFRTYFYQPFKIPTGSMENTLLGIHVEALPSNSLMARLKYLKFGTWIFDGVYVKDIRATTSGVVGDYMTRGTDSRSGDYNITISGISHAVPVHAVDHGEVHLRPGQFVKKGELIWQGTIKAGDHVFVDKIRWNFCPPKRGQVVVFRTDGIKSLDQGIHYIKRLVGLPGETVTIRPPDLLIDGITNGENTALGHVANHPGYRKRIDGPRQSQPIDPEINAGGDHVYRVSDTGYFCMGDNTGSSLDSRYWGSVPRDNMVGPAVLVYWPFSARWGSILWPSSGTD